MSEFPACFLLVFAQLAVGGIAALAVPPFGMLERGFYKSSAGVFVASAVAYLAGDASLALRAGTVSASRRFDHPSKQRGFHPSWGFGTLGWS